jgi:hypothetical protein
MLRAPWQWQRNDGRRWAFWLYLGVAVLLTGASSAAALVWMPRHVAWAVVGVLGTCGLLAVWGVQFSALLRLDHPHAARFVVGHGRALRAAAVAVWLVMVTFVVLVVALALALNWPGGAPTRWLVAAMIAGATLLYVAMALRWWVLWVVAWLPFPVIDQPAVLAALRPAASVAQGLWQDQPLLWTGLVLLALATVLANLFGRADPAHARAYARRERFRAIAAAGAAGQKPALAAYGRWGEALGAPFQRLADAWLAHVIRRASPQRGSVMARADVVLLGSQHGVRQLAGLVLVQGVVLLGLVWFDEVMAGSLALALERGHVGMAIGLSSAVAATLISLRGALWGSRREQALLMLLPGVPQGAALNQALARQQIKHYLLIWTAALPAFAALAHGAQAPQVWGMAGVSLPLAALLWGDVSRLRGPLPGAGFWLYLLGVSAGVLSLLALRWQPGLLLPWAVGVVALTAGLLAWRWRCVSQWPQALPAGRLA